LDREELLRRSARLKPGLFGGVGARDLGLVLVAFRGWSGWNSVRIEIGITEQVRRLSVWVRVSIKGWASH
jgi:hypothetical protein